MDQIEVRIHEEINDYQEKFYWFTFRQWLAVILYGITAIPFYLNFRNVIGEEPISYLIVLYAIPFALIGFIPIQKMPAEKMIKFIYRNETLFFKDIIYKTDKEIQLEREFMNNLSFLKKLQKSFSKKRKMMIQDELKDYIKNNIDKDIDIINNDEKVTKKKKISREERKQIKEQKKLEKFKKKALKKGWINDNEEKNNLTTNDENLISQYSDQQIEQMMIEYLKKKGADYHEEIEKEQ